MAKCITLQLQPTAEVVPVNDIANELEADHLRRACLARDHDLLVRE
jgi:hypothetical protein